MKTEKDELRQEYPEELIRSGVRGKHAQRFREDTLRRVIREELSQAG